jgi:hypothetical protein
VALIFVYLPAAAPAAGITLTGPARGAVTAARQPTFSSTAVHNALPVLTLDSPGRVPLPTSTPTLNGTAGTAFGDSGAVGLLVYPGGDTSRPAVSFDVSSRSPRTGSFSIRISNGLPDGQYTAVAAQHGVAGVGFSAPQTFRILAAPSAIGATVKLTRGAVSVSLRCGLPAAQSCIGTVLILTVHTFRPVHAGPAGQLQVMFAYVSIPGARTTTVSRPVPSQLARILRRAGNNKLTVRVSTELSAPGWTPAPQSAIRQLQHP